MSGFSVEMPPPPSINNAFVNRMTRRVFKVAGVPAKAHKRKFGRMKSMTYRKWTDLAINLIHVQVPSGRRCGGEIYVFIDLPLTLRGDIDNRIKGILDALVASQRIDDDRNVCELHVKRSRAGEEAMVLVLPIAAAPAPVAL